MSGFIRSNQLRPQGASDEEWLTKIYHDYMRSLHIRFREENLSLLPPHMKPYVKDLHGLNILSREVGETLVSHMNKEYHYDSVWKDRIFKKDTR